jgi:hypothetical protein
MKTLTTAVLITPLVIGMAAQQVFQKPSQFTITSSTPPTTLEKQIHPRYLSGISQM